MVQQSGQGIGTINNKLNKKIIPGFLFMPYSAYHIFNLGIMYRYNKVIGTIICTAFILQGCIYEITPKVRNVDDFLVIYGMITTEIGPHEITIIKTGKLYDISNDSVGGANVSLSDDKGDTIPLKEVSIGRYHTPETFAGQIGTKYKLNITLLEGKQYESEYVELIDVPGITELRAEYITKPATATTNADEGYQFYLDTEPGYSEQKYFKWDVIDDWEFKMPYHIYFYWDGKSLTVVDIPYVCYHQSHLKDILIANANEFQTNYITNYPLSFVRKSVKLQFGYGINVRQYALSYFSYNYWKSAIENNSPDLMNSKQPYQLVGNLKCVTNPDESVFGIFEASAVKVKSIEVEKLPSPDYSEQYCGDNGWILDAVPANLAGWPPAYIGVHSGYTSFGYNILHNKQCIFCEYAGGTTIRPEYWKKK